MKAKYDWQAASRAVSGLVYEAFSAQRHLGHRKRVNVLNHLIVLEAEIAKIRQALAASRDSQKDAR